MDLVISKLENFRLQNYDSVSQLNAVFMQEVKWIDNFDSDPHFIRLYKKALNF